MNNDLINMIFPKNSLDQNNTLFCFTCKNSIFGAKHILQGQHIRHNVKTLPQGKNQLVNILQQNNHKLLHRRRKYQKQIAQIQNNNRSVQSHFSENLLQIQNYFARVLDYLESLKISFIQKLKLQQRNIFVQSRCQKLKITKQFQVCSKLSQQLQEVIYSQDIFIPYQFYLTNKKQLNAQYTQLNKLNTVKMPVFKSKFKQFQKLFKNIIQLQLQIPQNKNTNNIKKSTLGITRKLQTMLRNSSISLFQDKLI